MDFVPIPEDIFTSICMDFVDIPECLSTDGKLFDCCFVIVCRLSGYITAIPCRKSGLTAKIVAQLFLSHCISFMGLPNEIVSDNDHLISSSFFNTLCQLIGIEQHFSIIYRPKGNGRAEAAVKAVINMLRTCLMENTNTWLTVLPWAVFQLNNLPGLLSKYSPFKLVFGRDPPFLGEIPNLELTHINVDCEQWFQSLDSLRKSVQSHITRVHSTISKKFLSSQASVKYEPGDKVWIRNTKPRLHTSKLDPLWTGPCEILERIGNSGRYKVALPHGSEDVHIEDLKPYLKQIDGTAIPCHYFQPKEKLPIDDSFVVNKILEHKIHNGKHFWKVRWKGYGPEADTWEPMESFIGFIQKDWKRWNKDHGIQLDFLS